MTAMRRAVLIFHQSPEEEASRKGLYRGSSSEAAHRMVEANFHHVLNVSTGLPETDTWIVQRSASIPAVSNARVLLQKGQGLASAIRNAAQDAKSMGYEQIYLLGSDLPCLTAEVILTAFQRLESADCVVGPSPDGGFFLMGLKARELDRSLDVLEPLPFFTKHVFHALMAGLDKAGLKGSLIPALTDVDSWKDLKGLVQSNPWFSLSAHYTRLIWAALKTAGVPLRHDPAIAHWGKQFLPFNSLPAPPLV